MAIEHFRIMELRLIDYSRVQLLNSVDSTNEFARRELEGDSDILRQSWGELGLVATADQTSGRGRLGREWIAPAGAALCTSFIIRPHARSGTVIEQRRYRWFTLLVALAALDTWANWGVSTSIKWPNDVMVDQKKVCGILAQLVTEPSGEVSVVAGIGMNLNFEPGDLPVEHASSALIETGKRVDHTLALRQLAENFARYYADFAGVAGDPEAPLSDGLSLLDRVRAKMSTLGMEVTVHLPDEQTVTGIAQNVSSEGEIVVRLSDGGERRFSAGDVVHLRPRQ